MQVDVRGRLSDSVHIFEGHKAANVFEHLEEHNNNNNKLIYSEETYLPISTRNAIRCGKKP